MQCPCGEETRSSTHLVKTLKKAQEWGGDRLDEDDLPIRVYQDRCPACGRLDATVVTTTHRAATCLTDAIVIREYCLVNYPDEDWQNHYKEAKNFALDLRQSIREADQVVDYCLNLDDFSAKYIEGEKND